MIVCEKCGGESSVYDSRPVGKTMRRRRSCKVCGWSWSTIEIRREALRHIGNLVSDLQERGQWKG